MLCRRHHPAMMRCSLCFLISFSPLVVAATKTNPSFMLAAGISSAEEMCVVSGGSSVILRSCRAAVTSGTGSEVWTFSNGKLVNAASARCMSSEGGRVGLSDCDKSGAQWEVLGSGQLKTGDACLSQSGLAAGAVNVARNAAVTASSTADVVAHAASAAVDGNEASFWASRFGETEPVTLTIDLGAETQLNSARIVWEFPALAFTISLSVDGKNFAEAFATDSNILFTTVVPLGGASATQLKITMLKPHPLHGVFQGHGLYGIKSVAAEAAGLNAVTENCAIAAKSADARDKYFQVHVGEFDPLDAKSVASELPALEAAKASVSATVSELAEALPKLSTCRSKAMTSASIGRTIFGSSARLGRRSAAKADGADAAAVGELMSVARETIMAARALLK